MEESRLMTDSVFPERTDAPETDLATAGGLAVSWDHLRFYEALQAGAAWLQVHVDKVNDLNVFPVPDGDTGTNMSMTIKAALEEVHSRDCRTVSDVAAAVAHGALMGARGNSGVILSQILRGMARSLEGSRNLDAPSLAQALLIGSETAYKGVMQPVEGTILTVARDTAEAALAAVASGVVFIDLLDVCVQEAHASVTRTPNLLPILKEANCVDSGGTGFAYILEGIQRFAQGKDTGVSIETGEESMFDHEHDFTRPPDGQYNYDTQFIITGHNMDVEAIRAHIDTLGDSTLVVGDSETIKVHVHCDLPGLALDYGVRQGQVDHVIIENMQLQYEVFKAAHTQEMAKYTPPMAAIHDDLSDTSIIAVVSGDGLRRVFESIGVSAIVAGGQTMNPSTQDLVAAVQAVPGQDVFLLPNNSNIILTAQQAKELCPEKNVVVVPSKTVPQGISALLAFHYQADPETNLRLMSEALDQVSTAEVTRAVRTVEIQGVDVREGQIIGLLDGDLVDAGDDITHIVQGLLERMTLEECEIITIYYGNDVQPDEARDLAEAMEELYPDLEIEVVSGGQDHYFYIISAE